MRVICVLTVLSMSAGLARAHPGVGIVCDSRGNVFYTDLRQVWRITPDGTKSVAVPDVHTHELCLDGDDALYGEHLRYDGARWFHRVWRLSKDGALSDVYPEREGFYEDGSFVRDAQGWMYWADRRGPIVIKKRRGSGPIELHARGPFRSVGWMCATPEGRVASRGRGRSGARGLRRKSTILARGLSGREPAPVRSREPHYQMGVWTDQTGDVYVAVAEESIVLRVGKGGSKRVHARSPRGWRPSGGTFDREGRLWLLEYGGTNRVRARRIDADGSERIY